MNACIHHNIIVNSVEAPTIRLCDREHFLFTIKMKRVSQWLLWFHLKQMFFTITAFVRRRRGPSSTCPPRWKRSACWSERECTVYWPQFCGSVVSNFTARFLSALTIMDGTAMREQGHLVAEPPSAPPSWQAWWMQADEYTHCLYYSLEPQSVRVNHRCSAVMHCWCVAIRAVKLRYIISVAFMINNH